RALQAIAAALVAIASACRGSQHDGRAPGPREAAPLAASRAAPSASAVAEQERPVPSAAEGAAWDSNDVDAGHGRRQACRIAAVGDSLTDETVIGGGYVKVVRRRCLG